MTAMELLASPPDKRHRCRRPPTWFAVNIGHDPGFVTGCTFSLLTVTATTTLRLLSPIASAASLARSIAVMSSSSYSTNDTLARASEAIRRLDAPLDWSDQGVC